MPFPLRTLALTAVVSMSAPAQRHDWPVYLGDKATTHYSTLDQISKQNVSRLREVWNYDSGEVGEFQSNGLVIDGVLYTATTQRKVLALNAATGKHIWTFDPAELRPGNQGRRQRGVTPKGEITFNSSWPNRRSTEAPPKPRQYWPPSS